jgi:hypothetical protein
VIKEDPVNENILYVGTDHGLYVSVDRGKNFMIMDKKLPHVAVHDLVIQTTAKDLVIGTHGRSIYRTSVKELEQLNPNLIEKNAYVFDIEKVRFNSRWGDARYASWYGTFEGDVSIPVFVKEEGIGKLNIFSDTGLLLHSEDLSFEKGISYISYDLTIDADKLAAFEKALKKAKADSELLTKKENDKFYLIPGEYSLEIVVNGGKASQKLEVDQPRSKPSRGSGK